MIEEEKFASLTEAQRMFLGEVESLLKIYQAMHGLKAEPPDPSPDDAANWVDGDAVWSRRIHAPQYRVLLTATLQSIDEKTVRVRAGRRYFNAPVPWFQDKSDVTLQDLAKTLEEMVGYGPNNPSARRPNQPLRRSRRHRRR